MGSLDHFHSTVNCSSKMGPCCYWNSISILLQYYNMEPLIIPFLNMSYAYSDHLDNAFITNIGTEQVCWTSRYFHINSSDRTFSDYLLAKGYPVTINIQLYPMSFHLPIFPRVRQLHYLTITGLDEENAKVIDRHFNFAGVIKRSLLFNSVHESELSSAVDTIYWISPNRSCYREDFEYRITPALTEAFLHHIKVYLEGKAVWNNKEYQTGLRALQSLHDHLPISMDYYFDTYHNQDAFALFLHRLNNGFTDQREGLLSCIPFFDGKISDSQRNRLVYFLRCSLRELKKLNYIAILGKLNGDSIAEIVARMQKKIIEAEDLEKSVEHELQTVVRSLGEL